MKQLLVHQSVCLNDASSYITRQRLTLESASELSLLDTKITILSTITYIFIAFTLLASTELFINITLFVSQYILQRTFVFTILFSIYIKSALPITVKICCRLLYTYNHLKLHILSRPTCLLLIAFLNSRRYLHALISSGRTTVLSTRALSS